MAVRDFVTEIGDNYKGGLYNSGSHMVGWDNGDVRSEIYNFTTGNWPITHIKWWGPTTSLYQGSNIPIRFAISLNNQEHRYDYVAAHGSDVGYAMNKGTDNEIDVNLAPNTDYCITFFPGVDRSEGWGLINIGDPGDENWFTIHATETDRTKCGAPTTLTLTPSIVAPGGTSRLSWSGATPGQNTPIAGYNIYRATSVNGTYEYLTYTNANTTNCNVTAPTTAGQSYYYKIITSAGFGLNAYNSDYSAASGGLKANTVPNAPTVSADKTVIPSTGNGTVKFTVTPGSDPDGQILSLYYATSSSGTKTAFTSPLTITGINSATTYYFYTYDGIAYSSATTQSITVNTKPVVSTLGYSAVGSYTALGGNGAGDYQIGFASNITPTITTNKTGKVTLGIEYYASNDGDETFNIQGTGYGWINLPDITINSTTPTLNNINIHQHLQSIIIQRGASTNIHWRIYARLNDGIETGDWVYYPSQASGQYYAIAHASELIGAYNQFSDSNISGTNTGEVWRNVRLKFYEDTSVPVRTVRASLSNSSPLEISSSTSTTSGVYRYVDITLQDNITSGANIYITLVSEDTGGYIGKTVRATVKETLIPTAINLQHGAQTVKPFTQTGLFEISLGWPFGSYATLDSTTLQAYNCDTTVSNVIKIIHSKTNSGSGTYRVEKTPAELYPWEKNGSTLQARMNVATLYAFEEAPNHELGITTYAGTQTYYCRVEITNLFGKVIATSWLQRTFDFREQVQNPLITSVEWSANGTSNWSTLDLSNDKIQKGIYLKFNCSFGLYTTDEVAVGLLLKTGSNERLVNFHDASGSSTDVQTITYPSSTLYRAEDRTVASNTKSYIYHVTSDIEDETDREWRLEFTNSGYLTRSNYATTKVQRQCAPTLTFVSCEVDADYNLTYVYNMTDDGGADSLTLYMCDDGAVSKPRITSALATGSSSGIIQVLEDYRDWEVKSISIEIISVVTGLITNTVTYYSNALIVYQLAPTIAYRQNQIGINTDNPDSDSTVDIHQASGKPIVLIHGVDSSVNLNPTKFEINATTGQIRFFVYDPDDDEYKLKSTLDLMNGTLTTPT